VVAWCVPFFRVVQPADYRQPVTDAGGKILIKEQDVAGMGTFSPVADPDGRPIGLWKHCEKHDGAK
jgi:predicted enzyme related to lactoylglutathione lyase